MRFHSHVREYDRQIDYSFVLTGKRTTAMRDLQRRPPAEMRSAFADGATAGQASL